MSPDSQPRDDHAASGRSPQQRPTAVTLLGDIVGCMTLVAVVIVVFGIPVGLTVAPHWVANPNVVMSIGFVLIVSFTTAFVALFSGLATFFGRRRTVNSFRAVVTSMVTIVLLMGLVRIGWEFRR